MRGLVTFTVETPAIIGAAYTTIRVILFAQVTLSITNWFDTFSLEAVSQLSVPRPVRAEDVTVNLLDTSVTPAIEMPLGMLTEDGWAGITAKDQTAPWPQRWYYNPTFPYGTLTLWPVPTGSSIQAVVYVKTQLAQFASLDDEVALPPAYERMIVTNLALELCPSYNRQPSPLLVKQAAESMAAVKRTNRRLSDLTFPAGSLIGNSGRRLYDIRVGP